MFISKKKNTKSFKQCKYTEDLDSDNLDELFDDNDVYRLVPVDKDNAIEVQNQKILDNLMLQQKKLADEIAKLSGKKITLTEHTVQQSTVPDASFVSEQPQNNQPLVFQDKNVYPKNPETGETYVKKDFIRAYGEFKEMAEENEKVVNVVMNGSKGKFVIELVEDIPMSTNHRGIPLEKKFI
jgi:hypothetical protein